MDDERLERQMKTINVLISEYIIKSRYDLTLTERNLLKITENLTG